MISMSRSQSALQANGSSDGRQSTMRSHPSVVLIDYTEIKEDA